MKKDCHKWFDYAIKMLYLIGNNAGIKTKHLVDESGLPEFYMRKILSKLRKYDIVTGNELTKPLSQIKLSTIIKLYGVFENHPLEKVLDCVDLSVEDYIKNYEIF